MKKPVVLSIAGSDPGAGAGIQADLKTFHSLGVYGTTVITALTIQNTQGVHGISHCNAKEVEAQLLAILDDMPVVAIKTGMLGTRPVVKKVERILAQVHIPYVVDPVLISSSGSWLIDQDALGDLFYGLCKHATLITPNRQEAEILSGIRIRTKKDMEKAGTLMRTALDDKPSILIKGGHFRERISTITDLLVYDGGSLWISHPRIPTQALHGTGCTLSAAITAFIGQGYSVMDAVRSATAYVQVAIEHGVTGIGQGRGTLLQVPVGKPIEPTFDS